MKNIFFLLLITIFWGCSKNTDLIAYKSIDTTFVGLYTYELDFQGDSEVELSFHSEIVHDNIEGHDTIAVVIHTNNSTDLYDNSNYGFITPLDYGTTIGKNDNWYNSDGLLATFNNSALFDGQGFKYVGYRFYDTDGYYYGWIQIYISEHNDSLIIRDYAFNPNINNRIKAGE